MTDKRACPEWLLNDNYGVGLDAYNWILYTHDGKRWNAVSYYPTPEKLVRGLFRRLCLEMEPAPTIAAQIEQARLATEGAGMALANHIRHTFKGYEKLAPSPAASAMRGAR